MADLQIKGIQDDLYEEIERLAVAERRSVAQQMMFLVKKHLASTKRSGPYDTPAQCLLELAGSWEDEREADEIIEEIRKARSTTGSAAMKIEKAQMSVCFSEASTVFQDPLAFMNSTDGIQK